MSLQKAFIPYGAYWTTPFCRWQGSFGSQHSVKLAAEVASQVLAEKKIDPEIFGQLILGTTIPQKDSFYGAPWLASMIGAKGITGASVAQACATSARVIASAALEIEAGFHDCVLGVTCDRTSNGPHLTYPEPTAPGGRPTSTDWVWDSFSRDPFAKNAMVETAEKVVKEAGFTREEQDAVTALRYTQYEAALKDDNAFQRRYMAPVTLKRGRKEIGKIVADEGIHPTTAEGLAKLRPAMEGGTVTFGSQTHAADGNAGIILCSGDRAAELSTDANVHVQLISYGEGRADTGMMPKAVVPAAKNALDRAGIAIGDCKAIKSHNPFAVNDLFFCKEFGLKPEQMNNYGSPLIYGHPQGPTGTRLVLEMIEELKDLGGGYGLFTGCAAGDSAMALVLKVG